MANKAFGSCEFLSTARVICGACGRLRVFYTDAGKGDKQARESGWQVEWRPKPFVRCPKCVAHGALGRQDGTDQPSRDDLKSAPPSTKGRES